jgi:hypothetical protein
VQIDPDFHDELEQFDDPIGRPFDFETAITQKDCLNCGMCESCIERSIAAHEDGLASFAYAYRDAAFEQVVKMSGIPEHLLTDRDGK